MSKLLGHMNFVSVCYRWNIFNVNLKNMYKFLFGLFIGAYPFFIYAGESYQLTHEQWAVPKRAETILVMPAIAKVLADLQTTPKGQLLIRYPGGDEGTLWAHELRSWLVSLGISSSNIELRPGSVDASIIELVVQGDQTGLHSQKNISLNKPPM